MRADRNGKKKDGGAAMHRRDLGCIKAIQLFLVINVIGKDTMFRQLPSIYEGRDYKRTLSDKSHRSYI